jgi:hypothetical protein
MAMGNDEVKRSAIIELFAYPDLLKVLPFMDVPGGSYTYTQEGQLPGVAFRGFNEAYGNGVGVVNSQVEVLKIVGGDLDVDKALIKTHGANIRTMQEKMKVKALSSSWPARSSTATPSRTPVSSTACASGSSARS